MILYLIPLAGLCLLVYLYGSADVPPPKDGGAAPEPPASTGKRVLKGVGTAFAVVAVGFVALVGLVFLVCAGAAGGR